MAPMEKMTGEKTPAGLKLLPEDSAELERSLKLARMPARLPVMAFDEAFQAAGIRGLSEQEREEGIHAWSALFWQWGLYRDGRVLVALWVFGVVVPRGIDYYEERRLRREGRSLKPVAPPPPPAPRVSDVAKTEVQAS